MPPLMAVIRMMTVIIAVNMVIGMRMAVYPSSCCRLAGLLPAEGRPAGVKINDNAICKRTGIMVHHHH